MHHQWTRSANCRRIGERIIQRIDDLDRLERLATTSIEAASEVEAPMIDHRRRELTLFHDRMNYVRSTDSIGMRRSRDVVEIEAGDRGGYDAAVAIDHRM